MGVTTAKKTNAITTGAIKLPKNIPNLNQSLFSGVNNFEFIKPKIKNKEDNIRGKIFIWEKSPRKDQKETIRKKRKKTKPKLLLDPILILRLDDIIYFLYGI